MVVLIIFFYLCYYSGIGLRALLMAISSSQDQEDYFKIENTYNFLKNLLLGFLI